MSEKIPNECEIIRQKLKGYTDGNLNEEDMNEISTHLDKCKACSMLFDAQENDVFINGNKKTGEYNASKIESMFVKKIIGRVLIAITLILVLSYVTINAILPSIYNTALTKKSQELQYAVADLINFTIPGAQQRSSTGSIILLNMGIAAEYDQKLVGGGLKKGKINLTLPIYTGDNDWSITSTEEQQGMGFVFYYPQKRSGNSLERTWEKLEKFSKGTKTHFALYFEQSIPEEDMERILKKIDADDRYTWMPIDTGDITIMQEGISRLNKPYRELGMHSPQWGFPMQMPLTPSTASYVNKDSDGNITDMGGGFEYHDVSEVAEKFKNEMRVFETYSSEYFDAPEFTGDLKKINSYIQDKGIRLTGVITGASTENVLKLRDEPNVARIDIIKVDFDY